LLLLCLIFVFYPNGTLKYRADYTGEHNPSYFDGILYDEYASNLLRALDADNAEILWEFPELQSNVRFPVIALDGTVYLATSYRHFYSVSPPGIKIGIKKKSFTTQMTLS